jgi:uncharacterized protein YqfA (UPF0365 family)
MKSFMFAALQEQFSLLLLVVGLIFVVIVLFIFCNLGFYWLQAYLCDADVSLISLVATCLLGLDIAAIVNAKIIARQSGLSIDRKEGGVTTSGLSTHVLAGGNVMNVITSMILAQRAKIQLEFDRAAGVDLAGRDLLEAIRTSITPKVIQCPSDDAHAASLLSAIAKDGVELRVRAQITVRTHMDRLIGGATDETIIARVGQLIISTIGAATSHMDILADPSKISNSSQSRGLDQDTAYAIVSIDIAQIVVGKNVGAALRIAQAEADMRIANARAEGRFANAVALTHEMRAKIAEKRVELVLTEAMLPSAIVNAICDQKPSNEPDIEHNYPRTWNEPDDNPNNDRRTAS